MARHRGPMSLLWAGIVAAFLLTGCMGVNSDPGAEESGSVGAQGESGSATETAATEEQDAEPRDFRVPPDGANVLNPITADPASLQRGEEIFRSSCVECHGQEGRGDGPTSAGLDPRPLDYRSDQVKALSDGELFYIITHGVEGSDMPAWGFFDDEDRWHLVNYVRTFQE